MAPNHGNLKDINPFYVVAMIHSSNVEMLHRSNVMFQSQVKSNKGDIIVSVLLLKKGEEARCSNKRAQKYNLSEREWERQGRLFTVTL